GLVEWRGAASRGLVWASRGNELSQALLLILDLPATEVRDGEDPIANTRDARAPRKSASRAPEKLECQFCYRIIADNPRQDCCSELREARQRRRGDSRLQLAS